MKFLSVAPMIDPCVAQLIDANLDRAREGLRVIEDWCRYGARNENIVITLKDWRQRLGSHHLHIYKQARSTENDHGIGLKHPEQNNRNSPEKIISANSARVQEALRVLEEFTSCLDPSLASTASKIRYGLYDLELEILNLTIGFKRRNKLFDSTICLVTRPQDNLIEIVEEAINVGINMIQYRGKKGTDKDNYLQAEKIAELCKKSNTLFIINDRIDFALALDADGVHLGQNDLATDVARRLIGTERLIGRSTNCLEHINLASQEGCDYIGLGPIFFTNTKSEVKPIGLDILKKIPKKINLPYFAIGGIDHSNVKSVSNAGAKRIAIVSAIMNSKNLKEDVHKLKEGIS